MSTNIPVAIYFNVSPKEEANKFRNRLCEAFCGSKEFVDNDILVGAEDPNKPNEVIMVVGKDNADHTFHEINIDLTFDHIEN